MVPTYDPASWCHPAKESTEHVNLPYISDSPNRVYIFRTEAADYEYTRT